MIFHQFKQFLWIVWPLSMKKLLSYSWQQQSDRIAWSASCRLADYTFKTASRARNIKICPWHQSCGSKCTQQLLCPKLGEKQNLYVVIKSLFWLLDTIANPKTYCFAEKYCLFFLVLVERVTSFSHSLHPIYSIYTYYGHVRLMSQVKGVLF